MKLFVTITSKFKVYIHFVTNVSVEHLVLNDRFTASSEKAR